MRRNQTVARRCFPDQIIGFSSAEADPSYATDAERHLSLAMRSCDTHDALDFEAVLTEGGDDARAGEFYEGLFLELMFKKWASFLDNPFRVNLWVRSPVAVCAVKCAVATRARVHRAIYGLDLRSCEHRRHEGTVGSCQQLCGLEGDVVRAQLTSVFCKLCMCTLPMLHTYLLDPDLAECTHPPTPCSQQTTTRHPNTRTHAHARSLARSHPPTHPPTHTLALLPRIRMHRVVRLGVADHLDLCVPSCRVPRDSGYLAQQHGRIPPSL